MPDDRMIAENGDDWLILAAPDNQDLVAAAAAIEEMNVSLHVVRDLSQLNSAVSGKRSALGMIVAREFLGDDAPGALGMIKALLPDLPIILAVSETSTAFERSMRQIGIFYYLLSPYDREEFLNVIQALYSRKAREHDA